MFSIGEFSLISRLSVKTLRYYHEEGILLPDYIDEDSGYRYYKNSSVDKAQTISMLREMEFSISDIKDIFLNYSEDVEISAYLATQKERIKKKIEKYKKIDSTINTLVEGIRRNDTNEDKYTTEIIEKDLDDIIFCGCRFKGIYSDVSTAFKKTGKEAGRFITGKPFTLYYDGEYKDKDADIEGGFPVSKTIKGNEVSSRVLPGGYAVTILHKGAYETIGKSYEKILTHIEENKLTVQLPTREIYHKGPGMIFRGNPDNYITEIRILITKESPTHG
ncbi:MAG: MerR family transcriptional regulator [bacterium]|nr:MerR family transcriptional regulator [bacterium]